MMILQTIIEILVAAVLIVGVFNEPRIAEWEQKQFTKIKERFSK